MSEKKIPYKIYLDESEIPTQWYNVRADMKNKPAPLLNPGTLSAPWLGTGFSGSYTKVRSPSAGSAFRVVSPR